MIIVSGSTVPGSLNGLPGSVGYLSRFAMSSGGKPERGSCAPFGIVAAGFSFKNPLLGIGYSRLPYRFASQ